ncbi:M1 family metallopeptidase [Pedobacter sp. AW31-3R]|uniref:M1 family metallopeptidase n=1 Tax=Pedobacter sp. AW31-3R TaxID=3445781 RepID=UPI003F9FBB21
MFRLLQIIALSAFLFVSCSSRKAVSVPGIEPGVSHTLALYRKSALTHINYTLELDIPAKRSAVIQAHEILSFQLNTVKQPLQIDFKEDPAKIRSIAVNDRQIAVDYRQEHLVIAPEYLKKGGNKISIVFQAGEGALNRNDDYLYTLFVPDRARTVFPCFDQPDLKATYDLTLHLPADWQALANAGLKDSLQQGQRKTYHFRTSDQLSTYLFAFAAGKFKTYTGKANVQEAVFLFRETDQEKLKYSLQEVFNLHSAALKYFEEWTGIPYPFQKFGFVAIPDFQFGGMEHPGTIQYKANTLFLDGGATKDQLNARTNLIAHETAHMWFGDLVTMNWFSDVWMKEVFANFMADKSGGNVEDVAAYDLKFLIDHVPAAYAVDRTQGANPIRQSLDNLKDAGALYGSIIYHKAPVMMQQLEHLMGKEAFQKGVREYLHTFANGNASWPDLINILDRHTAADLQKWNKVWVNESGRPLVDYQVSYQDGKISQFLVTQRPEYGEEKRVWPQFFELSLFYADTVKVLQVDLSAEKQVLKQAAGLPKPLFVLFNSSGQGYAQWPVDPLLPQQLYTLKSALHRATAYISLYEQFLGRKGMKPEELLVLFSKGLAIEQEELNIKMLTGYISTIYWQFLTVEQRMALSSGLEDEIWTAMLKQYNGNSKKQLFKAYQDIFLNPLAHDRVYQVWKSQSAPQGIILTEDDYTNLALSLALRNDKDLSILTVQHDRIQNADRKSRFEFIVPALSPDQQIRDQFFNSLQQKSNRAKESNVLAGLYYLHHPLRQASAVRYLEKSLDLLEEIQTTGDIFFPQSWLQLNFGMYQSHEAAEIVRTFLKKHENFNPKLKAKILQTTDNLFRAEQLNHSTYTPPGR